MNKYVYSICEQDYFPEIKTIVAKSYNHAIEKLVFKFTEKFDNFDDTIDDIQDLQEYLNENYSIVISDLEDIDEL